MGVCRLRPGNKDVPGTASMPSAPILVPKFCCATKKTGFMEKWLIAWLQQRIDQMNGETTKIRTHSNKG